MSLPTQLTQSIPLPILEKKTEIYKSICWLLTWCSKVLDVFLDMTWYEGFYRGSYWKLLNLAFTINDITILDLKANSKVFDKSSTQKETGKGKLFNNVNHMISMDTGMKVLDLLNYCLQQCLILNWNLAWA